MRRVKIPPHVRELFEDTGELLRAMVSRFLRRYRVWRVKIAPHVRELFENAGELLRAMVWRFLRRYRVWRVKIAPHVRELIENAGELLRAMVWRFLRRYRVRRVKIAPHVRELFENAGERRLIQMFSHNLAPDPHDQDLVKIFNDEKLQQQARAWLLEQEDRARIGRLLWKIPAVAAAGAAIWLLVVQERRWNSEDRPQLAALYLEIPEALDRYDWTFTNSGKDDATNIQIKIVAVDFTYTHHKLLTNPVAALGRLKRG